MFANKNMKIKCKIKSDMMILLLTRWKQEQASAQGFRRHQSDELNYSRFQKLIQRGKKNIQRHKNSPGGEKKNQ